MKTCVGCKHADWQRTANGRLHPNGHGRCRYPAERIVLPASMWWMCYGAGIKPNGGAITRRKEFRDGCPTYERGEA